MSASNIKLKRSAVPGKIPTVGNLELGEFAVNTFDGNLFTKKNVNGTETIVAFFGSSVTTMNSFAVDLETTAAGQIVDLFDATEFRTAKYLIQMSAGSDFHVTEILLIHDGTNTYTTEYGTILTNGSLGEFSSELSGGNVNLLVEPNQINTNVKVQRLSIRT